MSVNTSRTRRPLLRIAIVDEHRLVRDGITAHIAHRRSNIQVAISAGSWEEFLANDDVLVDVVLLGLDVRDSQSIAAKLRSLDAAGVRTVVMSSRADGAAIRSALNAGALAFVPTTDSADEVISAILAVAIGQTYLSPEATKRYDAAKDVIPPSLGRQEHRSMVLYATGRSIKEVAEVMGTTEETIKSYIKRARRKYRLAGIDVGTKILLRRRGIYEGWLVPD